MATEILSVPEEYLADTCRVIRSGLDHIGSEIHPEALRALSRWVSEEQAYMEAERCPYCHQAMHQLGCPLHPDS